MFTSRQGCSSDLTRKLAAVTLRRGDNHVLVKLTQAKNYWQFHTRFLTLDQRPAEVTGL